MADLWSPDLVEKRLLEAIMTFNKGKSPASFLYNNGSSLPDYVKSAGWFERAYATNTPPKLGATTKQATEAEETLGWIWWCEPIEREIMKHVFLAKLRGRTRIPWRRIRKEYGYDMPRQTMARHYDRGLYRIACQLSGIKMQALPKIKGCQADPR